MKELSKEEKGHLEDFVTELNANTAEIDATREKANAAIDEYNDALQAYNNTLKNVRDFQTSILKKMEEYMESKPEDWTETTEGSEYEDWHNNWEQADFEPLELVDEIRNESLEHPNFIDDLGTAPE